MANPLDWILDGDRAWRERLRKRDAETERQSPIARQLLQHMQEVYPFLVGGQMYRAGGDAGGLWDHVDDPVAWSAALQGHVLSAGDVDGHPDAAEPAVEWSYSPRGLGGCCRCMSL